MLGESPLDTLDPTAHRKRDFLAIHAGPATINNQEITLAIQRDQRVMPTAAPVVDALSVGSEEGARLGLG